MTEKIPFFKNQINDIPVPTEKLDKIILKTVEEHAVKRKRSLRRKFTYSASAMIASIGLLIGLATVSPATASVLAKLPIIGSIFNEFGDPGLAKMSDLGLTQIIGESKTIGDKTLTIDEVFYDGSRFTLSYSLESKKPMSEDYIDSMDFLVNGEPIAYGLGNELNESVPTHYTGIVTIHSMKDLSEEFSLHAVFKGAEGEKWEFLFPVQTQPNVQTIVTNYEQEVAGIHLSVTEIVNGPSGLKLKYKKVLKEDALLQQLSNVIEFRIKDDMGNEIVHNTGSSFGSSEEGTIYIEGNDIFNPISEDVKELTISPYFNLPKEGKITEIDEEGNEMILDLKQFENSELSFDSFTVSLVEK